MKKQGGPVTTGNTHTFWKSTLTRTIIKGKSTGNDGAAFNARTYAAVGTFTATTVSEVTFTANTTDESTTISAIDINATTSFVVGQSITGTGIPTGATIASITDANNITISAAATADGTTTTLTRVASNTITGISGISSSEKLVVGHVISGTGIPTGTTITALPSATTAILSALPTASGTPDLTAAASDTIDVTGVSYGNIYIGQEIIGTGIPANSKIASFGTGTGKVGTYVLDSSPTGSSNSVVLQGKITESWNHYGKTYTDNPYRPFNIFRSGTGAKFRFQYP